MEPITLKEKKTFKSQNKWRINVNNHYTILHESHSNRQKCYSF